MLRNTYKFLKESKSLKFICRMIVLFSGFISALQFISCIANNYEINKQQLVLRFMSTDDLIKENITNMGYIYDENTNRDKEYRLDEKCACMVSLTNNENRQIELYKIALEVRNIDLINNPNVCALFKSTPNKIYWQIWNDGWGDAPNVEIMFNDDNNEWNKYLRSELNKISLPLVKAGENIEIEAFTIEDLNSPCDKILTGEMVGSVDGEEQYFFSQRDQLFIETDKFGVYGRGGNSEYIYALFVDTERSNDSIEYETIEYIDSGEILGIPVIFYANRSCCLKFRLRFDYISGDNYKSAYTDWGNVSLNISSIQGDFSVMHDINSFNPDKVYDRDVTVSYPVERAIRFN